MAIKASTGSRAPAFWLRLALLHAFLLDRSAASFAKSGTGPSVVATSGSFSPPDLSEPNELDLLDDSEMPGVPQEQELRSDFNEDVRDKEEQVRSRCQHDASGRSSSRASTCGPFSPSS
ncbi:unnamed protein product [Cladocopium goreaui]|uniref:Secreted protein n=1 Tax=Cladocopium goreaui TaxID=2562237 RepID=A0A9P1CIC0_9DINO|nr:unnamed protein product [Cladocopium goreaui]